MKRSTKTFQDISGLHDLRTYTGAIKKSSKPALPTTAILDLYMRRNEKDRLLKELERLKKRRIQLRKRLKDVEKEMTKLLEKATKTAVEMRGTVAKGKAKIAGRTKRKGKMVLGY